MGWRGRRFEPRRSPGVELSLRWAGRNRHPRPPYEGTRRTTLSEHESAQKLQMDRLKPSPSDEDRFWTALRQVRLYHTHEPTFLAA